MEMTARLGLKVLLYSLEILPRRRRNGDDSPVGIESLYNESRHLLFAYRRNGDDSPVGIESRIY